VSVSSFVSEVWSANLLVSLKKSLIYGSGCNRDYEGEIAEAGDTVHINSVGRPTISTYVPNSTVITPEAVTTADRTLVVDQSKYFAFEVDDVDARQARGNIIDGYMVEAAYAMSDVADRFLAAAMVAGIQTANQVNSGTAVAITTGDIAYTQLLKLAQKLDEANVPSEGRWAIIPPWYYALLLDNNKFVNNANPSVRAAEGLYNGLIGEAGGLMLLRSNNVPVPAANQSSIVAGTQAATTYAEQISKTEAYRPQSSFADAIKGLHLYGAKVVRPDALALLTASSV
jgi:hypothetical protein